MPALALVPANPAPAVLLRASAVYDETLRTIPSSYGAIDSSPHPGVVAAAVLGSVAAFLVAVFLVYTCLNCAPGVGGEGAPSSYYMGGESILTLSTSRSRRTRGGNNRARSSRGASRSREAVRMRETLEVRMRESGGGPTHRMSGGARAPVIVDAEDPESESDVYYMDHRRGPPPARRGGRTVRTVSDITDDDDDDDDDEIVVVEEGTPSRRRDGRSRSRRSSSAYRR